MSESSALCGRLSGIGLLRPVPPELGRRDARRDPDGSVVPLRGVEGETPNDRGTGVTG